MDFLSLFVLVPMLMLVGFLPCKNIRQIRTVAVIGASILLALSIALVCMFLKERAVGNTAEMLFTFDRLWFPALNIHYSVGVDGISVVMLLLSSVIVFTGVFASWNMNPLPKEFFMWLTL